MGDRLGILRVVTSFFSSGIVLFPFKNIEFKESIFFSSTHAHDHTVWKIPVLVRSPQLN